MPRSSLAVRPMSEWRVEYELDTGYFVFLRTETEDVSFGSLDNDEANKLARHLNNLKQYKALAERAKTIYKDTSAYPTVEVFGAAMVDWLKDYDALKAQEAGQ